MENENKLQAARAILQKLTAAERSGHFRHDDMCRIKDGFEVLLAIVERQDTGMELLATALENAHTIAKRHQANIETLTEIVGKLANNTDPRNAWTITTEDLLKGN